MLITEIVGGSAGAVVGAASTGVKLGRPDDVQKRIEATNRQQQRRRDLAQKVRDAEAKNYQQHRAASEKQFRANDQVRDLKRRLASEPAG